MATKKPAKPEAPVKKAPVPLNNEGVDPRHNEAEALRLIKEAHRNPRQLTDGEIAEHGTRFVDLGFPKVVSSKSGRGRPSTKNQYDSHRKRWALPLRNVKNKTRRKGTGTVPEERIKELFAELRPTTLEHKLVTAIRNQLDKEKRHVPVASTVFRIIQELIKRG